MQALLQAQASRVTCNRALQRFARSFRQTAQPFRAGQVAGRAANGPTIGHGPLIPTTSSAAPTPSALIACPNRLNQAVSYRVSISKYVLARYNVSPHRRFNCSRICLVSNDKRTPAQCECSPPSHRTSAGGPLFRSETNPQAVSRNACNGQHYPVATQFETGRWKILPWYQLLFYICLMLLRMWGHYGYISFVNLAAFPGAVHSARATGGDCHPNHRPRNAPRIRSGNILLSNEGTRCVKYSWLSPCCPLRCPRVALAQGAVRRGQKAVPRDVPAASAPGH